MSEIDTQILGTDELSRIPECINAMSNSSGGVIKIEGGEDIRVNALEWYMKPKSLDGRVWRRIEGVNVVSGRWAKSVMATRDSCDDFSNDEAVLHDNEIDEFRERVIAIHPEFEEFSREEFVRRAGIFSGRHITSAGVLMFGEALNVQAKLTHGEIQAEIKARNIWETYTDILPRITRRLSAETSRGVRGAIITAIINSDYSLDAHINIRILSEPARIIIDSPGIITHSIRNHRLSRIAKLAGVSSDTLNAEHDMLNFRTIFTIHIEGLTPIVL